MACHRFCDKNGAASSSVRSTDQKHEHCHSLLSLYCGKSISNAIILVVGAFLRLVSPVMCVRSVNFTMRVCQILQLAPAESECGIIVDLMRLNVTPLYPDGLSVCPLLSGNWICEILRRYITMVRDHRILGQTKDPGEKISFSRPFECIYSFQIGLIGCVMEVLNIACSRMPVAF